MTEYNRVFVDTNPFIYLLERNADFYEKVKGFFLDVRKHEAVLVTSDITTVEYCVYPYRQNNNALIEAFDRFRELSGMEIVSTNEAIAKKTAQLRAKHETLKPMDALQLATAIESGCDVFLTNDKQLRTFSETKVILVGDL